MIFQTNSFVIVLVLKSILDSGYSAREYLQLLRSFWNNLLPRWFKPSSENVRSSVDSSFLEKKVQVFLTYLRSNDDLLETCSGRGKKGLIGGDTWRQLSSSKNIETCSAGDWDSEAIAAGALSFIWVRYGLWKMGGPGDYYSWVLLLNRDHNIPGCSPDIGKTLFTHPFHFSDKI